MKTTLPCVLIPSPRLRNFLSFVNVHLPCILALFLSPTLQAQTSDAVLDSLWREYIRKYKDIAMDEMERSGVPASIKLAQGILESRAGTSELAVNGNNHFGIKCGKGWKSGRYFKNDDERNKKGERINSCFRKYHSVVECFADHSEFIRNPEKRHRYGFLFELDPLDYKAWARGLQEAGYSSVHYYADRLIFFIERYRLHEYDALAVNGRVALKRLAQVNDVKMVQARSGETLSDIAELYKLPLDNLLQYNDFNYTPDNPPGMGAWVYVQNKREHWNGAAIFHSVEQEQSLFDIAQLYGLQIAALRKLNGLQSGEEPAAGERLRLRGKPAPGEKVRLRTDTAAPAEAPDAGPDTAAPAMETVAANGFIVEMLPEEPLAMPAPVHWPAVPDSARATPVDPSVLLLDHEDPAPLIVFDTATGKTETYHTVSRGDTLYSIARKYGVSTQRLRKMNGMTDNVVKIGQSLRVN